MAIGLGIQRPGNLCGINAFVVGLDGDGIVLRHAAGGLLEPSDALVDVGELLARVWPGQPV